MIIISCLIPLLLDGGSGAWKCIVDIELRVVRLQLLIPICPPTLHSISIGFEYQLSQSSPQQPGEIPAVGRQFPQLSSLNNFFPRSVKY